MTCVAFVALVGSLAGCLGTLESLGGADNAPNTEPNPGCAMSCHGAENSNAPPRSVSGATETTSTSVGAHQQHLSPSPSWHAKVECADCHVVPSTVDSPGHMDGDNKAEVMFSTRVGTTTWNGTTCTSGCHGQTAWGGTQTTPVWTKVDGTQSACGSCHGAPPPPPHPTEPNCASCHPTMEENSLVFRDPTSHINGTIDLVGAGATGGCTTCHGSTNSAPPKDLAGNTAPTSLGVGAHQAHLASSNWRHAITCSSCHVVPTTVDAPGHRDGDNKAELDFDTMNPIGNYTAGTCSTMYCHGNGRGGNGTIGWLAPGPLACTSCHPVSGVGMSGKHQKHVRDERMLCSECHQTVVNANQAIINADLHVNGVHEVKMATGTYNPGTRQCSNLQGCHGNKGW
jgi:predicted CxxxxCH...CXXCH cytochrome family protein